MSHIALGRYNQLEVVKEVDFGVYLNGDEDGEILLPKRYVPAGCKPGDVLNVFIYLDMEERLVATTLHPYVQVGEFASLEVAWVNQFGAFLNWGLMKDLFVPFREQKMKMLKGNRYIVHVHLDEESFRIVASARWNVICRMKSPCIAGVRRLMYWSGKRQSLDLKSLLTIVSAVCFIRMRFSSRSSWE